MSKLQPQSPLSPEWEAVLARTRALSEAAGITTEEEVERRSDDYRTAKQAAEKRDS